MACSMHWKTHAPDEGVGVVISQDDNASDADF
jgi:hypothetical protein